MSSLVASRSTVVTHKIIGIAALATALLPALALTFLHLRVRAAAMRTAERWSDVQRQASELSASVVSTGQAAPLLAVIAMLAVIVALALTRAARLDG
ncbi:MAG: hypothetical protein GEV10_06160 [Streptosporangiales bacterium]|nr:hypothetical protein [Streptosporangiales bacterium]